MNDAVQQLVKLILQALTWVLNRRTPAMREEKRRIIKDKLGELGHVDLHQLPRDMFLAPPPAATAAHAWLGPRCSPPRKRYR